MIRVAHHPYLSAAAVALLLAAGCSTKLKARPVTANLVAVFDPTASPPAIPLPNDLARSADGTHLMVPSSPGDSPAQKDFAAYLSSLDGFPPDSTVSFAFSAPVDPASVKAPSSAGNGSLAIFDTTGLKLLTASDLGIVVSPDGKSVTVTSTARFVSGHVYVAMLFGYGDANGVRGAKGESVIAAPTMYLLRSPNPLIGLCGTGQETGCVCPAAVAASGNINDPTCHAVVTGVTDAQARQLEAARLPLAAALGLLVPLSGSGSRSVNDLALVWNFTIAKQPFAVYDPTRSDVPMPNDVLIDQTTHLVSLSLPSTSPLAGLAAGLNTLDGFSTTGALTVDVDAAHPIDPKTLIPGKTVYLINPGSLGDVPLFDAAPVYVNGGKTFANQIAITPRTALASDQSQYLVVLTTGVKDTTGLALTPAPVMSLIKESNPLVVGGHSTVSILSDAQATQLEVLRSAFVAQNLFATLAGAFGVPRAEVASVFTFTTESVTRPLQALAAYPASASLVPDVANVEIYPLSSPSPGAGTRGSLPFCATDLGCPNVGTVVTGTFHSRNVADPLTGIIGFDRTPGNALAADAFAVHTPSVAPNTDIPFVMTLPVSGSNWPVAIVQHGLGSWRGDMLTLADRFAQDGWATIAFDLPYHGARSACTADSDCTAGGTCSVMTGLCSTSLALYATGTSPTACTIAAVSGGAHDATSCEPVASGSAFVNLTNLLASRDNLRQYIVDASQLVRVLQEPHTINTSLAAQAGYTASIPQIAYHGLSLGGIAGAVFLAVAPEPVVAVLTDCGGHDFEELADGYFSKLINPFLAELGIMRDTAAYNTLVNASRWILDPADPFAVAQFIVRSPLTPPTTGVANVPKILIQQEDANDPIVPNVYQEALSRAIFGPNGLDANGHTQTRVGGNLVSTFFTTASHSSELGPPPSLAVTEAVQNQIVTFISSGGTSLPPAL